MCVCVFVFLRHNNVCHQRGQDIKPASVSLLNTRLGHGMFFDSGDVSHRGKALLFLYEADDCTGHG